jgi:type IV pilus assembly protein PilB
MFNLEKKDIDEILLETGVIKLDQFKRLLILKHQTQKSAEELLLEEGAVSKLDINKAKAALMDIEFVDLTNFEINDESVPKTVTKTIAKNYTLIPIAMDDSVLTVAMKDPTDIFAIDDVRLTTALEIKPVMAEGEEIEKLINKYFAEPIVVPEPEPQPLPVASPSSKDFMEDPQLQDFAMFQEPLEKPKEQSKPQTAIFRDDSAYKLRIGDILVNQGIITEEQLKNALADQAKSGEQLGKVLINNGFVEKNVFYETLSRQIGMPLVNLTDIEISPEVVRIVPENISRRYKLIAIERDDITLKVAMSDPMNVFSIDDLRLATGMEIIPILADGDQIDDVLDTAFPRMNVEEAKIVENKRKVEEYEAEIEKVKEEIAFEISESAIEEEATISITNVDNAPVVKLVNIIFERAVSALASDIHIEPYEDCIVVRYRIDGQLVEVMKHEKAIHPSLIARVKIISGLNIAEKRIPQDGRITIKIGDKEYDLRVSILPTMFGEKAVMRIASKGGFDRSKKELGFFDDDMEKFDNILAHPHGVMLVTGPTGSGKSTTLYTALRELCKPNVNIVTVEDPVENIVRGVNQVQVNVKAGLTFASALRSFLRQDPDIIMLGEIRDGETAEIATRAAITGHLVLSTLHTNDAASAVTRMIDMGIEPFLIASSLVGVMAQRLVRRLCPKCKEGHEATESEIIGLGLEEGDTVYTQVGCPSCNGIGYKGRIAIYEIMTINSEIKDLITKNVPSDLIKEAAVKNGMKTLRHNCIRMIKDGVTTVEELYRVAYTKE